MLWRLGVEHGLDHDTPATHTFRHDLERRAASALLPSCGQRDAAGGVFDERASHHSRGSRAPLRDAGPRGAHHAGNGAPTLSAPDRTAEPIVGRIALTY